MAVDQATGNRTTAGRRYLRSDEAGSAQYRSGGLLNESDRRKFSQALGWFSIALGTVEIVAPRTLSWLIGTRDRPLFLRLLGARELASGIGILSNPISPAGAWSRVAGDAMDLSLLGLALASANGTRARIAAATAAVAGVTAADAICARELSRGPSGRHGVEIEGGRINVERSIAINLPAAELYRFWRNFENLPRFMSFIELVQPIDEKRSRWIAKIPGGEELRWEAEITRDEPDKSISWASLAGGDLETWGSVRFENGPGGAGTMVTLEMRFAPRRMAAAAAFGRTLGVMVKENLRRFKQLMETGEIPTIKGQPSGRPGRSEWA